MKSQLDLEHRMASAIYIVMFAALFTNSCLGHKQSHANSMDNGIVTDDFSIGIRDRPHVRHQQHHQRQQQAESMGTSLAFAGTDSGIFQPRHTNFLLTDYLTDGEMERRINFNGITAKETSISTAKWVLHRLLWLIINSISKYWSNQLRSPAISPQALRSVRWPTINSQCPMTFCNFSFHFLHLLTQTCGSPIEANDWLAS